MVFLGMLSCFAFFFIAITVSIICFSRRIVNPIEALKSYTAQLKEKEDVDSKKALIDDVKTSPQFIHINQQYEAYLKLTAANFPSKTNKIN